MANKKAVDINNIDLGKLNKRLRFGDKKKIAERSEYCYQYVLAVLDPENPRMNTDIIETAIKVIEEGRPIELPDHLAKELVA